MSNPENQVIIGSREGLVVSIGDEDAKGQPNNNLLLVRNAVVVGLGLFSSLLVGYILGSSITASRLITGTLNADIDPHTGIAYAHNGLEHPVLKTEDVVFYSDNMDIVGMSNDELNALKEILLDDGNVKFLVKGYGRGYNNAADESDPLVHLIVEGGTLTWDTEGIVDATGDAVEMIFNAAFPQPPDVDVVDDNEDDEYGNFGIRRRLPSACTGNGQTGSGPSITSRSV